MSSHLFSSTVNFRGIRIRRSVRFLIMDAKAKKVIFVAVFCLVIVYGQSEPMTRPESGNNGYPQGFIGDNDNSIHQIVVDPTTPRPGVQPPTTPRPGVQSPTTPRPAAQPPTTPRPGSQQPATPRPGAQPPTTPRPGAQQPTTPTPITREISAPTTSCE